MQRVFRPAKKGQKMGDVIDFDGKDNAILEELMEPERSDAIDAGGNSVETIKAKKDNVVPLHSKSWPPIDWEKIEAIRKAEYPRLSKKAVGIIKRIFENPGDDCYFDMQNFEGEAYPPDPVPIRPILGDAVWMMDLLDRFGGEVRCNIRRCIVKRTKKKPALFIVQPISRIMRDALIDQAGVGPLFEHFLQSKWWTVIGKEATEKLMVLIISNRQDEERIYSGFFDHKTAKVLFRRMEDIAVEKVLGLDE